MFKVKTMLFTPPPSPTTGKILLPTKGGGEVVGVPPGRWTRGGGGVGTRNARCFVSTQPFCNPQMRGKSFFIQQKPSLKKMAFPPPSRH